MTHIEKIELLKNTIEFMYEKEGRSISYISKLLEINNKQLSKQLKIWGFKRKEKTLNPSTIKFLNKNKNSIIKKLNDDIEVSEIAKDINSNTDAIYYIINRDDDLKRALVDKQNRNKQLIELNKKNKLESSNRVYIEEDLNGEFWENILGYPNYYVSNLGRIKKYAKKYNAYYLLTPTKNSKTNRLYVSLINKDGKRRNLLLHRVVAFTFVSGYSDNKTTVNHIDGDIYNNKSDNLEWVSQSDNNKHSYETLNRKKSVAYSKYGKFKEIVIDNQYRFKTIVSASKFLGISSTQFNRIIDGVCKTERKIKFIY